MIKTVDVDEFEKLIKSWEYEVIDIRTQQELDYFWVIPWMTKHLDIYTKIDQILSLPKNKKYLIYCYHWNRSWTLLQYMNMEWFEEVIDLAGWTENWLWEWKKMVKF